MRPAWRNRLLSASLVAVFVAATRALLPDANARAEWQYLFTITLGYGHLLGASLFARGDRARRASPALRWLGRGLLASSALSLLGVYSSALGRAPALAIPLLTVSVWHTVENDLALERAYADRLRLGPLPRSVAHHGLAAGAALLVALLAGMTPEWRAYGSHAAGLGLDAARGACVLCGAVLLWSGRHARASGVALTIGGLTVSEDAAAAVGLAGIFVATTLYHLVSWLVFFADRARALRAAQGPAAARAAWRRVVVVHVAPAAVCAALLASDVERLSGLRFLVFSPAVYLFWSVLHVAHTAWARGVEPWAARRARSP